MGRVGVVAQASDQITLAGVLSCLRSCPDLEPLDWGQRAATDVVVVSVERLTSDVVAELRRAAAEDPKPVVLVVDELSDAELLTAVECRVVAVVPRAAASGERLAHSVLAASSGGGVLPPDLLGRLLDHVQRMQQEVLEPNGLSRSGLTSREVDVLRLLADGLDTAEIADELSYSARTVKNVVYGMTTRLNLRNRPHAVAYGVRTGLI